MERKNGHLYKSCYSIVAIVVCFLLLIPVFRLIPADAQQTSTSGDISKEPELETKIRVFFDALKRVSTSAIDDFLRDSNSPLAPPQSSSISLGTSASSSPTSVLKTKVDECRVQFGDILNWEKIEDKKIGNDIIVFRYALKYNQYPVIWTFAFYRKPYSTSTSNLPSTSGNVWSLVELNFDNNIIKYSDRYQ